MEFAFKEGGAPKMSQNENKENVEQKIDAGMTLDYKIYPTLIDGEEMGRLLLNKSETGWLRIYTVQGKQVVQMPLKEGINYVPYSNLSTGVLIYKVWVNGEMKRGGKLVKVE